MTSPHDHDALEVSSHYVDQEGTLVFLVTSFDDPWATVELSPTGAWYVGYADLTTPDATEGQRLISLVARHIIEEAFGGKDSCHQQDSATSH